MRIGVFGGSFDPIHLGHLLLAETCREMAELDQVWFIPAAQSPHKQHRNPTAAEHRWQMLQKAIEGQPAFIACDVELARGGVSFTVDTLEWLKQQQPTAELFLLLGGDSLVDLPRWREPARICELALPLVVRRPGSPPPDYTRLQGLLSPSRLAEVAALELAMPQVEISSSDLRERVAAGRSIRYRTPGAVETYIREHRLYQADAPIADNGLAN